MRRNKIRVIALLVLLVLAAVSSAPYAWADKKQSEVTIFRDGYGVPHIYADTVYAIFYGYGYAIATDRLFQMEMSKRTVEGTTAEVLGPGPVSTTNPLGQYVNFDINIRSNFSPAAIQKQYQALTKSQKDIFDGYAAGMNARIDEVMNRQSVLLPKQFTDYGFLPTKWTAYDVIMVFVGTMCNRFSDFNSEIANLSYLEYLKTQYTSTVAMDIFNQTKWINDPGAPTTIPNESIASRKTGPNALARFATEKRPGVIALADVQAAKLAAEREVLQRIGLSPLAEAPAASNVWLVGQRKTVDKGSILLNGPQFGWFNPGYVYEVGLHGAGFDLVGSSPFGYPAILFGHNGHIAWGSTAGVGDVVDIYEEQLNTSNKYQYYFKGKLMNMEKRTDTILVKGQPSVNVDIYRTVHGFVVSFDDVNHKAYSKKRTWEGYELESLIGWIESTQAPEFQSWRRGAEKMAITINWYYADRHGHIGYIHCGKYPIRPETQDLRLPASGTGNMEWQGVLPFSRNPQVLNPETGYITNWNNKPAVYWNDADFQAWGSADRVNEIIAELEARDKFLPGEVWDMNRRLSFVDLNRRYFLPFLEQAVAGNPGSDEAKAVNIIKGWDGYRWDLDGDGFIDSPGLTILAKWLSIMLEKTLKDDLKAYFTARGYNATGYPTSPPSGSTNVQTGPKILYHALLGPQSTVPNTYDFFNGVQPLNVVYAALTDTIAALTAQFSTGNMSKWLTQVVKQGFFYTNFNGIPQASPSETLFLPIAMNRGTENHMVVLGPHGPEGQNVCPPGQSGFVAPGGVPDAHYQDQMDLYKNFQSKPMLFNFQDVAAHTASVIKLRIE
jgi:penicillin G amidase